VETVILCGGKGTRLRELTQAMPKVLVEIGGKPILWHIMKTYAHQGFSDFVLALGHLGDEVRRQFQDTGERWSVDAVDTGLDTQTGGRIARLADHVRGGSFFATYGDGVSDIDLNALLRFHHQHGRVATVTVVRPRLQFGLVEIGAQGEVRDFTEKPMFDGWINGGFFVFDRRVFDYLDPESILEREPMRRLAADGQLMAYRHEGFWACMDTYKDSIELNNVWASGEAPWNLWHDG
jgi:glucose-1-phosphate cytidylyltransferase